jgi:S-adenosylmethionine/arginine decarboxylase-like enzyme
MYWGYHLILDCSRCIPRTIRSKNVITDFSKKLVKKIDMVPHGEPQVVMFGNGNKKGYTLVQLIETSNICAHFVEETNDMYLDVFSCKPFNPKDVKGVVNSFFVPEHMNEMFLNRDASMKNGRNIRMPELR